MYCNQCGKQIPDGSRFCNFCGANLTAVQSTPVQSDPYFDIRHGVLVKYRGREKNVVVPAGVVEIEGSAFTEYGMESLTIPEGCRRAHIKTFVRTVQFPTTINDFSLDAERPHVVPTEVVRFKPGTAIINGTIRYRTFDDKLELPIQIEIPSSVTDIKLSNILHLKLAPKMSDKIENYHPNVRSAIWRYQGKCQYCGGEIKGSGALFNPRKCRICGKKMDYEVTKNSLYSK